MGTPEFKQAMAVAVIAYLVVTYVVAIVAARRVRDLTDFLVAGRSLPLSLAWMTILATWFGAGTLLAVADEVRASGAQAAALDPLGAGCCLLFVGVFVAAPLWREKLLTVPEFFGRRYGRTAEGLAALILVPSYFGWVAAQFVAVANMLQLFFDIDVQTGLVLAAVVGGGYTLLGGMWSVTITDALQITLALVGLVIMLCNMLGALGSGDLAAGLSRLATETPPEKLRLAPIDDAHAMVGWLGVFAVGMLGNVPVQDLMQRVFAARCAATAQRACLVAGCAYLLFGAIPVMLALGADLLYPDAGEVGILPLLAQSLLSPTLAVVFVVSLLSIIMSTIDSALLAPASVIAHYMLSRREDANPLFWNRVAIAGVTACSLAVAFQGENAYALLEQAYALTLVGLFVPFMMGIYRRRHPPEAAVASMLAGVGVWGGHLALGWETFLAPVSQIAVWEFPVSLAATAASLVAYLAAERFKSPAPSRLRETSRRTDPDVDRSNSAPSPTRDDDGAARNRDRE